MASTSSQRLTRRVARVPSQSSDNPIQNLSRFISDSPPASREENDAVRVIRQLPKYWSNFCMCQLGISKFGSSVTGTRALFDFQEL